MVNDCYTIIDGNEEVSKATKESIKGRGDDFFFLKATIYYYADDDEVTKIA